MEKLFLKLILALVIATAFLNVAWADQAQTPAEIQDQINAQLNITADDIKQIIKKMEEKSQNNDGMKHADYLIKAPIERERAQKALDIFEDYLKTTIFPEVQSILINYNNVYKSNAYTPPQKQVMLQNTSIVVNGFFREESLKYHKALMSLYEGLGAGFGTYSTESDYPKILSTLVAGCFSVSCVSFSISDEVLYYSLVHFLFGDRINFRALNGTMFYISPNDNDGQGNYYINALSDESRLPQDIKNLPFDIDSTAYGAAVAKNRNSNAIVAETCKPHGWSHKCKN